MAWRVATTDRADVPLDPRRLFTKAQRRELYRLSGGACDVCGRSVAQDEQWIAGHYPVPHAHGGQTIIKNGRVECLDCAAATASKDAATAAKIKRLQGRTGQRARRERKKERISDYERRRTKL